ncbi:MAG TPA: DUF2332 domain-containing protein [Streptosporangiaceae bacterium]
MWMHGHDLDASVARNYRDFAQEAAGRSPAYEALALDVAGEAGVLAFLETLPPPRRQPNLLFAAARFLLGSPPDIGALCALTEREPAALAGLMLRRRTQTNEPARCATLLPALAGLPEPLALIEVGASAGLTLLPDRYSYDYAGYRLAGSDPGAPVLRCDPRGPVPLPAAVPEVAWRAGLDLSPLDVRDDEDVRWLSCLVWPGEGDRAETLAAAIEVARRDPPPLHRGDLLTDLPALAARAPAGATLVIYHSAVLAYVEPAGRSRFAAKVGGLPATWLSNEAPGVLPGVPAPPHDGHPFMLIRDGRVPLALTEGHGAWLHWLPPAP